MARAEQQAYFITAAAAAIGGLAPVPGGVLVKDDSGSVVGCVGVSGDTSDNDELAAMAGITSASLSRPAARLNFARAAVMPALDNGSSAAGNPL